MSEPVTKYFIQRHDIDGPGIDVEVPNNDIVAISQDEEALGKYAYGFDLYEIDEVEVDGQVYKSEPKNRVEVILGDIVTKEQVLGRTDLSEFERGNLEHAFNQLATSNYSVSDVMVQTNKGSLKELPKKAVVVNKGGKTFR